MSETNTSYSVWDCENRLKVLDQGPIWRVKCPMQWDSLEKSPSNTNVRHCKTCDKDVYLCRTPADFVTHAEQGHCVAIPDGMSADHQLGQPEPAEVLRQHERIERGTAWWEDVVRRQPSLGAKQMDMIQASQEDLGLFRYSKEHLAIVRLAVESDGARCPHCGHNVADDTFGVMIYLATKECERCHTPFDLNLPSE